jgi:hypothetical protein
MVRTCNKDGRGEETKAELDLQEEEEGNAQGKRGRM